MSSSARCLPFPFALLAVLRMLSFLARARRRARAMSNVSVELEVNISSQLARLASEGCPRLVYGLKRPLASGARSG
ncbi:hypothetical protein CALVIDRAFT_539075 [Calocera viscosa TUFC12733]|uniref:Secreted protein n=1 Tax=Calocera viscosa (strain TUFC12733) TaxID=1330018 RepID=A0A167K6M9_CALVF|nr:hypothetical protein CALVIDRAFT_539075 [Calocera viscosa TUFC12733]